MRKKVMTFLRIFSMLVLIVIVSLGGYTIQIINNAKQEVSDFDDHKILHSQLKKEKEEIFLEEGSLVEASTLEEYLSFSQKTNGKNFIKKLVNEKSANYNGRYLEILQTVPLPPLIENHCKTAFCFQHRLAFNQIPVKIFRGLIGIEDYRYLEHSGFDFKSIFRAFWANLKAMRTVQGGSTLTQQLVKNLYFTKEKSFKRKFKELIYSIYIELKLNKEQIISAYLNEVYWGVLQGVKIKGIDSASRMYFGKRASALNDNEVAILIALLKGPGHFHPIRHTDRLVSRSNIVIQKLIEYQLLSPDAYNRRWSDNQWKKWINYLENNEKIRLQQYPIEVINLEHGHESSVLNSFEKLVFVKSGRELLKRFQGYWPDADLSIKAIISKVGQKNEVANPFSYYSKIERDLETAIFKEKHLVGSILKPIVFGIMVENGFDWNDMVETGPIELNLLSGNWSPRDASKVKEEEVTIYEALQRSLNRATIRLANNIGFDFLESKLRAYFPELKGPLKEYPSQLLGAIELSPWQVYKSYNKFIKNQCELYWDQDQVTRSLDLNNDKWNNSVLMKLSNPEETTVKRVLRPRLKGMKFFGKTGTSNNGLDNWYVGFDSQHIVVIWVGLEGNRVGKKFALSGTGSAFQIFQNFFLFKGKAINEFGCP